jgi:hypothetical protein
MIASHTLLMKRPVLTTLIAVFLIACSTRAGAARGSSPNEVASRFYRAYLKLKIDGLPNDAQYKVIAPLLSSDLRRLIRIARNKQAKFIAEHPDEKPPWIEGAIFSSLFEGAHSFRLGPATIRGGRAWVPVHLEYREGKDSARWTDILALVQTRDGWRIRDILLKGDWQFKMGSSLRQILQTE